MRPAPIYLRHMPGHRNDSLLTHNQGIMITDTVAPIVLAMLLIAGGFFLSRAVRLSIDS